MVVDRARPSASGIQRFLGLLFLNLFVVVAWLASVAPFFSMTISDALGGAIGLYSVMIYPVLLLIAMAFLEFAPRQPYRNQRQTLALIGVIALLAGYGILRANAPRTVAFDTIAFLTVFGGYVLGRKDRIWRDLRPIIVILLIVSVLGAFAFTSPAILIDRSLLTASPGSFFETPLVLAPLFCMVAAFERERRWFHILLVLTIASFIVYLYFGRRGITVRCALELAVILFVIPAILKQFKSIVASALIAVALVFGLLLYFPFATLIGRYAGDAGVVETITTRNERWTEAVELAQGLNAPELFIGRGMGGTHQVSASMDTPIIDEVKEGEYARLSTHSNAANILLKGGLFFLAVCYTPIIALLLKAAARRRRRADYITLAVTLSALVALPFQSIEGTITMTGPWVGFGFGLLMSRSQNLRAERRAPSVSQPHAVSV